MLDYKKKGASQLILIGVALKMEQNFFEFIEGLTALHKEHAVRCIASHGDRDREAKAYDNYGKFLTDSIQTIQRELLSLISPYAPSESVLSERLGQIINTYSQEYQAIDDKQQRGVICTNLNWSGP